MLEQRLEIQPRALASANAKHHQTATSPCLRTGSLAAMNLSGTFNVFRLIISPTLCLPHHTISTFNQLPIPLSKAFEEKDGGKRTDIRAVILDKDNCFARPHENEVYGPYKVSAFLNTFDAGNIHTRSISTAPSNC